MAVEATASRHVSLDEVVARVAATYRQPLWGDYPTRDRAMPYVLLWGLYGRVAQMDAIRQYQTAYAMNIAQGGEGSADKFTSLGEVAFPDG